jgi:glycine dehydrogenase subunit 1
MPFIPHTDRDVREMLATIGVGTIDELFDEIPQGIRSHGLTEVPEGLSEMDVLELMQQRASRDGGRVCFMGAGCYDHHVPAAVWDIVGRGEFYTAYTPYQAEASQGTLQLIYEYQSMMTRLLAMDVSNASVYDGGSGLGEAILMAARAAKKAGGRKVLVAGTLHPLMRSAAWNVARYQNIEFEILAERDGVIDSDALPSSEGAFALVIPQPNFLGNLEAVDRLVNWAHEAGLLVIAVVNPLAMALLKPPGQWGRNGVDITCGDGQPLGIPMASGGPSFGFLACKEGIVRQMPGRIIGKTVDLEGRTGYTLTLQAREQHIRRAKATSNICTNQGLLVTAATLHMSLLGPVGLRSAAAASHERTRQLLGVLTSIPGVTRVHNRPFFNEAVIRLPKPATEVSQALLARGILGGLPLSRFMAGRDNELLICATEKRTAAQIDAYAVALAEVLR